MAAFRNVDDEITRMSHATQGIRQGILNLLEVGCGLGQITNPELTEDRCIGRCLVPRFNQQRCNLPRINDKWCVYHTEICSDATQGYHAAVDRYGPQFGPYNGKIGLWIDAYEDGKYSDLLRNSKLKYNIFENNIVEIWDEVIGKADISSFLSSVATLSDVMEMKYRFLLSSLLRMVTVYACYYNEVDNGHIRGFKSDSWVYRHLNTFLRNPSLEPRTSLDPNDPEKFSEMIQTVFFATRKIIEQPELIDQVAFIAPIPAVDNPLIYGTYGDDGPDQIEKLITDDVKSTIKHAESIYRKSPVDVDNEDAFMLWLLDNSKQSYTRSFPRRGQFLTEFANDSSLQNEVKSDAMYGAYSNLEGIFEEIFDESDDQDFDEDFDEVEAMVVD